MNASRKAIENKSAHKSSSRAVEKQISAEEILDSKRSFDFLKGAKRRLVIIAMQRYAKQKVQEQRDIMLRVSKINTKEIDQDDKSLTPLHDSLKRTAKPNFN